MKVRKEYKGRSGKIGNEQPNRWLSRFKSSFQQRGQTETHYKSAMKQGKQSPVSKKKENKTVQFSTEPPVCYKYEHRFTLRECTRLWHNRPKLEWFRRLRDRDIKTIRKYQNQPEILCNPETFARVLYYLWLEFAFFSVVEHKDLQILTAGYEDETCNRLGLEKCLVPMQKRYEYNMTTKLDIMQMYSDGIDPEEIRMYSEERSRRSVKLSIVLAHALSTVVKEPIPLMKTPSKESSPQKNPRLFS